MHSLLVRGVKITWCGHATFLIEWQGKTAYFDPFALPANPAKADFVFITHGHFDHCDAEKVKQVAAENTSIACGNNCVKNLAGMGTKKTTGLAEGQSASLDGVKATAVPAYNVGKPFHPRGFGVGLVVDFGGVKIYHAGDTDRVAEMKQLAGEKIAVALLPIGGHYTMDAKEAAQAADDIQAEFAVPMHFDTFEEIKADPREFAAGVGGKTKAVILKPLVRAP